MKLKEIRLKRFKRFTDLTVLELPETCRLVVIAGPNGCGKTSFFEALNVWARSRHRGLNWDSTYHVKSPEKGALNHDQAVQLVTYDDSEIDQKKAIYIRSAYRNDPDFKITNIGRMESMLDENRLNTLADNDATVNNNYKRLASQALEDVFEKEPGDTTIEEFREKVIGDIKAATQRLFPDLIMNSLGNPLSSGTFKFDKGEAKGFLYKNLSGGEKAAFDLLLDVIVKRREYDNTIFCIDEPEAHMNSKLQGQLLKELYEATGESCQLWLATHSVGMMRQARDLSNTNPDSIVFLDFGGRDFDTPQVVKPEKPTRAFWQRVLDVAFDDFAALIAPRDVILCEGSRIGSEGRNAGLDAKIYDIIFSEEFPETRFIPAGNSHDVEDDKLALIQVMNSLVAGTAVRRLVDRDDMSDVERSEKISDGLYVLERRSIENYLFDDELIHLLCAKHEKSDLADQIISFKAQELEKANQERRRPSDDVKASAGPLMNKLKSELGLTQCGGNIKEFMRVTMAPLMTPETNTYKELRSVVFGIARQT